MFGAYDAKYSGIRIIFGCTGEDDAAAAAEARPEAEHGETHQWFGDGCYTLVFTGGGEGRKQHNVAVCIADGATTTTRDENPAWNQLRPKDARTSGGGGDGAALNDSSSPSSSDAGAREACLAAVAQYGMPPDVVAVVERCERFFDIGVHYHDTLDAWSNGSGSIALAGDSCHAMPPFLGQGANQSLQDSWCIAECLSRVRPSGGGGGGGRDAETTTYGSVKEALDAYEDIRKPPTSAIMLSSRVIGFVETGTGPVGLVRDLAFATLGTTGVAGKIFLKNAVPVLQ